MPPAALISSIAWLAFDPEFIHVAGLAVAEVALERVIDRPHEALLDQQLGDVGPARLTVTGFAFDLFEADGESPACSNGR